MSVRFYLIVLINGPFLDGSRITLKLTSAIFVEKNKAHQYLLNLYSISTSIIDQKHFL